MRKNEVFEDCVNYILNIPKFAGKNTLDDTYAILEKIIDVSCLPPIIHVAGTNGKGSVCSFMKEIMTRSGLSVGMFTSPHLVDIRERIAINNMMISKEDFIESFECVKLNVSESNHPSFFEYLFLMSMVYFEKKKPDYIILETGLGGRLDATNCVKNKKLCVITEIGFDHMQYLGDTIKKIAYEKAGIIRENTPLVYCDYRAEASDVIEEQAQKKGVIPFAVKLDDIQDIAEDVIAGDDKLKKTTLSFSYNPVGLEPVGDCDKRPCNRYTVSTTALYQCENAAVAIAAIKMLKDARINNSDIADGLYNMYWPARMEEILPNVYLDGAHNEDGINAFLNTVSKKAKKKRILMFGVVNDKNYELMVKKLIDSRLFDLAIVSLIDSERTVDMEELKKVWSAMGRDRVFYYDNSEDAYDKLIELKKECDEAYITGSLYLAGSIMEICNKRKRFEKQMNFALEIDKEKNIFRQTHLSGKGRNENDAEHAWHMAVMAYLLREYSNEPIDISRVMIMCLIHDIVEIDAGDTYCYDPEGCKTQKEREERARERIYSLLPDDQKIDLQAIFDEFEEGITPESRFAHAMDNIQPLSLNNSNGGMDWREHGVFSQQVYGRQRRTKEGSEFLYRYTEKVIEDNIEKGNIKR